VNERTVFKTIYTISQTQLFPRVASVFNLQHQMPSLASAASSNEQQAIPVLLPTEIDIETLQPIRATPMSKYAV